MTRPDAWDSEKIAKLEALLIDEVSAEQIAHEFGMVSKNAVIGKVRRLVESGQLKRGFKKHPPPPPKVREPRAATTGVTVQRVVRGKGNQPENVTFHEIATPPTLEAFNKKRRGKALLDVKHNQCMWPVRDEPYLFCAMKTTEKRYCAFHAQWSKGTPYKYRAKSDTNYQPKARFS